MSGAVLSSKLVRIEMMEGLAVVAMVNPPVNALGSRLGLELSVAFEAIAANPEVRAVVVASDLDGFFMAGADLAEFQEGKERARALLSSVSRAFDTLAGLQAITFAAINGHALGGGLELALCCDIRYAAEGHYSLGLPEVTLGLLPGGGGTQRLPALLGSSRALEWMIRGKRVPPKEALEAGLVQGLFPGETLKEDVLRIAAGIAAGPTVAIRSIKKLVRGAEASGGAMRLEREREMFISLFDTKDAAEGIRAFLRKETPRFTGE